VQQLCKLRDQAVHHDPTASRRFDSSRAITYMDELGNALVKIVGQYNNKAFDWSGHRRVGWVSAG